VTGCDDVSAWCDHCYARTFAERWRGVSGHYFERGFDVGNCARTSLTSRLRWTRPRRIFVNSMSDLFHKDVPDEYIACAFTVMAKASRHTFQVLTKRHARMRALLSSPEFQVMCFAGRHVARLGPGGYPWPLPTSGSASVRRTSTGDIRIPALLDTAAAVRFISAEPLLGPLDLGAWLGPDVEVPGCSMIQGQHTGSAALLGCGARNWPLPILALDWVIAAGKAVPAQGRASLSAAVDPRAVRLRMVPLFMKQLGSALGKELGAGPKGGDRGPLAGNLRVREFRACPNDGAAS